MTQPRDPDLLRGCQAIPVPPVATDGTIIAGDCRLMGWSLAEPGLGAASVTLLDGGQGSGRPVGTVNLTQGQSATHWFGPHGIQITSSLALAVTAGAIRGTVYVIDN